MSEGRARCGARHADGCPELIRPDAVEAMLVRTLLIDLVCADLVQAPIAGAGLRERDALHLAEAIRVGVDAIVTEDDEQASGARRAGLDVVTPA